MPKKRAARSRSRVAWWCTHSTRPIAIPATWCRSENLSSRPKSSPTTTASRRWGTRTACGYPGIKPAERRPRSACWSASRLKMARWLSANSRPTCCRAPSTPTPKSIMARATHPQWPSKRRRTCPPRSSLCRTKVQSRETRQRKCSRTLPGKRGRLRMSAWRRRRFRWQAVRAIASQRRLTRRNRRKLTA